MNFASTGTFIQAPLGIHVGSFTKFIDLGTQTGEYDGKPTIKRQAHVTWELPEELMDDGQPFTISKFYTQSLHEKAGFVKDYISFVGKAPDPATFDPKELLGKPCQVIVAQRVDSQGREKHVVSGLAPIKAKDVPKSIHNPLVYFDLDNFDQEVFDAIPQGIQGIIAKSPEYAKVVGGDFEVEVEAEDKTDYAF